eukprot:350448-Chlamydomonas_euryale.AAC.1
MLKRVGLLLQQAVDLGAHLGRDLARVVVDDLVLDLLAAQEFLHRVPGGVLQAARTEEIGEWQAGAGQVAGWVGGLRVVDERRSAQLQVYGMVHGMGRRRERHTKGVTHGVLGIRATQGLYAYNR